MEEGIFRFNLDGQIFDITLDDGRTVFIDKNVLHKVSVVGNIPGKARVNKQAPIYVDIKNDIVNCY